MIVEHFCSTLKNGKAQAGASFNKLQQ